MDHRQAHLLLAEHLAGRLDRPMSDEVAEHMAGCAECRDWSETYRFLAAVLVAEERGSAHVESERLARYAVAADGLAAGDRAEVEEHLAACADCAALLEISRGAAEEARPEPGIDARLPSDAGTGPRRAPAVLWTRLGPSVRGAIAAGLAVVAVGLTAILYQQNRTLRHELQEFRTWTGPVEVLVLGSTQRSAGELPELRLRRGQPNVLLAVQPQLPPAPAADETVTFTITTIAGEPRWELALGAAEAGEMISSFQAVLLHIPVTLLGAGGYELQVRLGSAAADEPLVQTRFRIVSPPPQE